MINSKQGKMDGTTMLILGVAFFLLYQGGSFGEKQSTVGGQTVPATQKITLDIASDKCLNVEDQTLTVSVFDTYDSTVPSGGTHMYRINSGANNAWKTLIDGASITVSPGHELEFILGNSTQTVLNSYQVHKVTCDGANDFGGTVLRNGTSTIRFFNQDNNNLNAAGDIETLAVGDVVDLTGDWQTQFERGPFAYGGCAVIEYATEYDLIELGFNGVVTKGSTPAFYTVAVTNRTTRTYEIPPIVSNKLIPMNLHIDSDDATANPTETAAAWINLTMYPNEYRVNGDTNKAELFKCGQDQNGARVANPITTEFVTVFID